MEIPRQFFAIGKGADPRSSKPHIGLDAFLGEQIKQVRPQSHIPPVADFLFD